MIVTTVSGPALSSAGTSSSCATMTKVVTRSAPTGDGTPTKVLSGWPPRLNLARRSTVAAANVNATPRPIGTPARDAVSDRPLWNASHAGATPNATASTRLSSCAPKSDCAPSSRAMRPSTMSKREAAMIARQLQ